MDRPAGAFHLHVAEFLRRISTAADGDVLRDALDVAASTFDAEVVLLLVDGAVGAQTGLGHGREALADALAAELVDPASRLDGPAVVAVPGLGPLHATLAPVASDPASPASSRLAVLRGRLPLTAAEHGLLLSMGRTLGQELRLRGLVERERDMRTEAEAVTDALAVAHAELEAAHVELEAAHQRLVRAEGMKDEFLAVIAHELRSPLTAIFGFTEVLITREEPMDRAERERAHAAVLRNGQRLRGLIDDLLDVSRLATGDVDVVAGDVEVGALVREALQEQPRLDPGQVSVRAATPVRAWADPRHLRRIVGSLVSNAAAYGAPPVEVEVAGPRDGAVEVAVTDHGPGVPEEFVPHLFETFTQASTGTRRTAKGTGVGLSIARSLAEANGGSLEFDGAAPGTRFVLRVPAVG